MKAGARIAAAAEVLETILARHQPTALALSDWGKAHRFAGSGDRNAIGGLVYDALRRRASLSWAMASDTPRALAVGAAAAALGLTPEAVAVACDGSEHAPTPLTAVEIAGLTRPLDGAPPSVQADVPEWLWPQFEAVFGNRAIAEGQSMARRAPADLRVNVLKATREKVAKALVGFSPEVTPLSPVGLRVRPPLGPARTPNLEAEAAFQAGWFEIQDEGSQLAALLAAAAPAGQVLDLCAGAGGKTLALSAAMQNKGQIYAYDEDRNRLKPIYARLKRAGARNVQVIRAGDKAALGCLGPRFDVVLVDAPCTGSGTWRRRPDNKWRLKPANVADRQEEQRAVLDLAKAHVRPGGRIVYVTCSILAAENSGQIARFLGDNTGFRIVPYGELWRGVLGTKPPPSADGRQDTLLLAPGSHGTDGFFIATMEAAV